MPKRERKPDDLDPLLGLHTILHHSPRMGVPGNNHDSVEKFVDSLISFDLLDEEDRSDAIEYVKQHNQRLKPATKKKSSRRKKKHSRKKSQSRKKRHSRKKKRR